jgi:hypothetical protein
MNTKKLEKIADKNKKKQYMSLIEAITLIYRLRAITVRSDKSSYRLQVITDRSGFSSMLKHYTITQKCNVAFNATTL